MAQVNVRSMYVSKSSNLLAGTSVWKNSSVACGFSSIKIDYSDYLKTGTYMKGRNHTTDRLLHSSMINRINEVYVFFQQNIAIAIVY